MSDDAKTYENEAAQTRDRIADTIDELQARLSPKALVDNALDSLTSAGSNAVASVRGAAGGHPLVMAAAGLAVGIGLLARSRVSHARVEYGDSYAAYADYDDGYADNLAAGEPRGGAARAQLDAFQHQAHETIDDNPLAVVAVGLATGALIGAILPVSGFETAVFGEVNRRLTAAADAAVATAKREFSGDALTLKGGPSAITERITQSLTMVIAEAGAAAGRPVSRG